MSTDSGSLGRDDYLRQCLALARLAAATGDSPVGSLIVREGEVIGEGVEAVKARNDVTAHAEIEAIRAATARTGSRDLAGCTLYTNVAPCPMCDHAIRLARITEVVSGPLPPGPEFSPAAKDRLTHHDLGRFPGETLFDRLARAV